MTFTFLSVLARRGDTTRAHPPPAYESVYRHE